MSYQLSAMLSAATAGSLFAFYPGLDNIGGTTHAGGDLYGADRTILGASAALHASVKIDDSRFFPVHLKDGMGTDVFAHTTADAGLGV